ncbi:hypothetical protein OE749_08500 [Aestuariibacter sp. AA17]|uniref:Chemotaxis protein methyltransferase n=1 Tax=Fluctibacter corallii TaxID=2984329 RepID=A0ABT3A7U8_9ALTE|nr:CheR family methyltransferase [Aestuariibacter sp. AA17]MCV2884734.1 hypothetical protein [Aestuariibacter sp. AA17]
MYDIAASPKDTLKIKVFNQLCQFVHQRFSIRLTPEKKHMVEGRLRKRLPKSPCKDLDDYVKWSLSEEGEDELIHLIDALTTNKTDFFREPKHFDYMSETLLQSFAGRGIGTHTPLHVWSSACSSGAEPYTIAMVLREWSRQKKQINYHITASDISVSMLQKAKKAVYTEEEIAGIPSYYRQRYLLRSKSNPSLVKIEKPLRNVVQFKMVNLNDNFYDIAAPLHLIFCRNVLIYFDKTSKAQIIERFYRKLSPKGYLMIGHSETINDVPSQFKQVAPTIYQRD